MPGKIGREKREMIFQAFKIGVTKDVDAINYACVSADWYYNEIKTNPEFKRKVEEAKTKRKMRALAIIMKAAETSWAAAGWFLERTYQDEFSIKQRHELSGPGGNSILGLAEALKEADERYKLLHSNGGS